MIAFLLLLVSVLGWSLTLEEAKELAVKRHIDSLKSELELKKLEEKIREVRGSVLPSLKLSATYTRWDKNYISSFVPENKYFLSLSLNQPIFDRSVWEALKLAKESKKVQSLVIEDVRVKLSTEVEKLFWAILLKREILREKRESLKYWENYFNLVKRKYEEGIIPRYEFLRARAQLRSARAELIKARSQLEVSLNALKSFLGMEEDVEIEGELKKTELPLNDPFKLLEKGNTTLKVLKATYRLKLMNAQLKKAEYYPKLSFFFNYNLENIMDFEGGRLKEDYRHGYNLGLRFDMTIYDGGKRKARILQERIESGKVLKDIEFTKRKLRNELSSLMARLRSAEEELEARRDTLIAATESFRFASSRYAEGVGSQVELLEARKNYEESKLSFLSAIYNYNLIISDIKRLLGLLN
jgi:outer membrane protein TolC